MHAGRLVVIAAVSASCRAGTPAPDPLGDGDGDGGSGVQSTGGGDGGSGASDGGSGASDTAAGDGESGGATSEGRDEHRFDLPAPATINDGHFATSPVCAQCHSNAEEAVAMRDAAGLPIAPDDLWQGTMMANSARDPFWWAMVKAEGVATPSRMAEIEAECTRCHAPMAAIREDLYGGPLALDDLLDEASDRAQLGLDGVSCAACHQVPAGEGTGPPSLAAVGEIYGPHAEPFSMPMTMHTGFTPVQASHVEGSAMCGTCHTLHTTPLAADGSELGGLFVEQAPYLEWRNSVFSTELASPGDEATSCQGCHMPRRSEAGELISTRIARRPFGDDFPPLGERSPYGRHVLVGGNTLVPSMLRDFADELRPRASPAAIDATIAAARAMLQERTATLSIDGAARDGDVVVIPVRVDNLAGHKLPSGIPSRRVFLSVTVHDARGAVVFRSGGTDAQGRLVDGAGTVLAHEEPGAEPEPHHTVITDDSQVQVYEAVMQGADGEPTYRLLRATAYAKDSRLLPRGWSAQGPAAEETAPRLGVTDLDFVGGSDRLEYRALAPAGAGPYTVEVQLRYQAIGARFAAELFALDAPEIRAFERMWEASARGPEPIASAVVEVP